MISDAPFGSRVRSVLRFGQLPLDARVATPAMWVAVLGGASLGLLWGIAARLWMRLIAIRPEFSPSGTAFILLVATLFGLWSGLAWVGRRRGWQGWRHYLPRVLVFLFFVPFGFGGGAPLMLTVLLATLALTRGALFGVWGLAALLMLAKLTITEGEGDWLGMALPGVLGLALTTTAWKGVARGRVPTPRAAQVDRWLERVVRLILLLLALAGIGFVVQGIIADKPGLGAPLYILLYLALLYPLFLGLRIALEPRRIPPQEAEVAPTVGG